MLLNTEKGSCKAAYYDLIAFAKKVDAESAMFLVGSESDLPKFEGTLYLADAATCGEYNPDVHKQLLLETIGKVKPDMVVFCHSSYGWDLAPRVAHALKAAQVSEVVDFIDGLPVVPVCNSKLRRKVAVKYRHYRVDPAGRSLQSDRRTDRQSHG